MNEKKKTAVIYDKWLHSLGGGEVVACNMAKIIKEAGWEVTFVTGKIISPQIIKKILGIDLKGIKLEQVWNDELLLKDIVQGKDLFINTSFIDYSLGFAKKNIYYTHFPTKPYTGIKSILMSKYLFPFLSKVMKPVEFINRPIGETMVNNRFVYSIENHPIDIAFSYLEKHKVYQIKFSIFFETFSKQVLKCLYWTITQAHIKNTLIKIDHHHNVVHFHITVEALHSTIYLHLEAPSLFSKTKAYFRIYLLTPKILPTIPFLNYLFKRFYERLNNKLRAGLFVDALKRLDTYQLLVTHSRFVNKWIRTYWDKNASILYPPVDLLFKKYDLRRYNKENWICSVGRFFTIGHGKKQEILVKAFKKLYDRGFKDWSLHLVGGLENETSSRRFAKYLKKAAKNYPIFFYFNANRRNVERIILKSKIYWHATGYGENENKHPVRFEHFGIAPIEAVSARNIPILYHRGGLKEIVSLLKLNKEKNLFISIPQLVENTIYFIEKKPKIPWKKLFQLSERYFSQGSFRKSFMKIINKI